MQLGLGLGLTRIGGGSSLARLLFSNNEPGFTFEPWDISTLFQDRAGTTPVTAAGQSVGYRRDKSGRGNHQVSVSDAKRGVYGWMPKTGKRNIEQYTDDLTNAVWSKGSVTVAATSDIDPLGSVVSLITISGAGDTLTQTITVGAGDAVTMSRVLKRGSHDWVRFTILNGANEVRAWFNLATGAVGTSNVGGTGVLFGATVANLGGGYYRCTLSGSIPATTVYSMIVASAVSDASFSRAAVSSTRYQSANQSEIGFVATAYQRVVSQYDITEAGVPTCYYVQADGVDDAYVTPTITPNTDKVQVFAGVRKLRDAASGTIIAEFSTTVLNTGSFYLITAANSGYGFGSNGGTLKTALTVSPAAPSTDVLTGLGDISGDLATLRINGTQVVQSTADQGTSNYLAYPAYIYGRGGTLQFNGLDFGHAVRFGPNLDAATIARVESLIARNTPGVTL